MTRRGFLTNFLKGAVLYTAAPQILTHGLGLKTRPKFQTVKIIGQFKLLSDYTFVLGEDIHEVSYEILMDQLEPYRNLNGLWIYKDAPKIAEGRVLMSEVKWGVLRD